MPPEVLSESKADTTTKIDVWAIGCILFGMLYGKLPFWGNSEDEFAQSILKSKPKFDPKIPISLECKQILIKMLDKDPNKRLDILELMGMDYFQREQGVLQT
jgi:serine/threonine protein kinase